jgi:CheY-like chemotaxis protein
MSNLRPILLVEDEEHDVLFMQIALDRAEVKNPLVVVRDGRSAIAYLAGHQGNGDRQQPPVPRLVLLDLRLPRVPGLEVLKWIRQQPSLAQLPVFVLTSSDQRAMCNGHTT